ncbi:tumor protein p53-inducible protein 13 precursor [Mus musculus]|uniref:Tumor protein p53-inducible protein 13 n=3 Tax=Mus musculus TaxID=10090 RepID=P5I13_MOUSE|nr:tumor protein p53-inducible protein 13 precursor [Mus musculus]Q5F267.1 RecName: Full=Tumor protein p53-inducible protein 13; Flags: Precursor [Mus musculus]AAI47325.1 Transformation related protein 53 inducible protein 13 [Mus musculus]AAI47326.1 Transformation related protein 53 inducible protein 13 [Mus musculus]EDL12887.1 tumor protein p53 inducible protein 13, isoform CRA_c [Mus musculus]|eukprot:NP_001020091.1 tumor protein p53-inducible protein 13 precursor [Mus musculus]
MVHPPPPPPRLLLVALVGLLSLREVVAEPAEEAGTPCPEGLWPVPPQVLPRVTYTQVSQGQAEGIAFFYHPCAHPWLKLQLALLAHLYVAKPTLIPDFSLTWDRPLVLTAWGTALELAWIEPAWVAHWLKRQRRRKQRKSVWFLSDNLFGPTPTMPASRRGKLCGRRCVQAPTLAFALRSWRPPGAQVTSRGSGRSSISVVKRRGLRAALGLQSTPPGLRVSLASSQSLKAQQLTLGTSSVAPVSLTTGGPGGNGRSRTEAQMPSGQGNHGGCACPGQVSPAPRAAGPPRVARGPTPRTEEAAWAAMALTFLLVLLTLATLCTRLHRNFRRSESIYWGPTADSQDTVAALLKRRLPLPSRRIKRSRRRPLLPPTPDSGPDSESSD